MKKITLFYIIPLFVISIYLSGFNILGNNDDPNLDQPPKQYWDHVSGSMPGEVTVITDNSGFDNFDLGVDFSESHISSSPKNPNWYFVAYNTNATYYTLNGLDWQRNNPFFPNQAGDPVTAYDSLGNLYYDNMKSPITGTWNIKSTNGGVSWLSPVSANIGNDKNWIAADQTNGPYSNYIYGVMTPGNVVRSTDGGASYNLVFSASNNLPGMMVAVGANTVGGNVSGGCVYVVTNTGNSFAATYSFFRSTNGGQSFDFMSSQNFANYVGTAVSGRNSVQNFRTRPYPFITADNSFGPNRGRLYLVYSSNTPAGDGNKPDIFCRYSTNHGTTWSSEVRINDDPNTVLHNQWHPSTWCDKETGRLYVQWNDTRDTPTSDSALVYASYSTDGGATFVQNKMISNKKFRINCTTCGGGGTPAYLGDYSSITSNSVTAMLTWTDFRNNNFGSYVGYYPDFALKTSSQSISVNSGQNVTFRAIVPAVKDYGRVVKFTATMDTLPAAGSLNISFVGKDSVNSFPDSVSINVAAVGSVTPGRYSIKVIGKGPNGTPIHSRYVSVLVNSSFLTVGTNRPGTAEFSVNGIVYNQTQQLVFTNGASVNVTAISPRVVGATQYVFTNWSNSGDTSQTIVINSNTNLTAFYKTQYRLLITSSVGNTFGGGVYYDSASSPQIGVLSRVINSGGTNYYFRGWTGIGAGSYTSPDSTGLDSVITINNITVPIVETARWTTTVGINQLSSLVPDKFSLYQNYPNPFNPTTNIKFDIIKSGGVKVIVYNALGKEVNVLLNENLSPGTYKVDFDGAGFASGIYYYKIVTSEFTDVKKMLLIK
ncbi:MAG TPA: T9SS type A sorting domain-containing protein [Ignavibacteria bacterium]|nr:T9SS type A sorting domain-containing protein [Ignavibacteria bacterium]